MRVGANKMNLHIRKETRGFTLIELMLVVAIIGILALIAIPNFITVRKRAYNASAVSAGRGAKTAQEMYYVDNEIYTTDLLSLLASDPNLTDDPDVTFTFIQADIESYIYVTSHFRGDNSFRWIN